MTIYFSSDFHFRHKRVIDFGYRPFRDLKHMERELINRWNSKVKDNDTVYIVGDFSFVGKEETQEILDNLNGNKIYIAGNHDREDTLLACFIHMLGKDWEVVHNPDDSSCKNVIHGHIHLPEAKRVHRQKNGRLFVNVNVELWDYAPVSVKQIAKEIKNYNKVYK